MGRKPYSCEVRERAVKLYQEGLFITEISHQTGIHNSTILNWLKAEGIETSLRRGYNSIVPIETKNKALVLYKKGLGTNKIAKMVGVSQRAVLNWVTEKGINRNSHATKQITDESIQNILALYKKGHTARDVAEITGISKHTVLVYLKKHGITRKNAGENHSCWKGGITPSTKKIRDSAEYKDWRGKVFERDGWTCQQCKVVGGCRLEAHHILSFKKYPLLRFDVNNGITLCETCHKKLHGIYKKGILLCHVS